VMQALRRPLDDLCLDRSPAREKRNHAAHVRVPLAETSTSPRFGFSSESIGKLDKAKSTALSPLLPLLCRVPSDYFRPAPLKRRNMSSRSSRTDEQRPGIAAMR